MVDDAVSNCHEDQLTVSKCVMSLYKVQTVLETEKTAYQRILEDIRNAENDIEKAAQNTNSKAEQKKLSEIIAELQDAKGTIAKNQAENQEIQSDIDTALGKLTDLSQKQTDLELKIQSLNAQVDDANAKVNDGMANLLLANKKAEEEISDAKATQQAKLNSLQTALSDAQNEMQLLRTEESKLLLLNSQLEKDVADSSTKLTAVERQVFLLQAEVNSRQAKLTVGLNSLDNAERELAKAIQNNSSPTQSIAKIQNLLDLDKKQMDLTIRNINDLELMKSDLITKTAQNPNICAKNTYIAETYDQYLQWKKNQKLHTAWAVAAPCNANSYCGMIETGATPFDAQQNALEACNRQCGGNPCVILYSDSDQVLCPRNDLTKPPGPQNPCLPLALLPQYKSSPLDNPSAASKNTALQYYMLWVTAEAAAQKVLGMEFSIAVASNSSTLYTEAFDGNGLNPESANQMALAGCITSTKGKCTTVFSNGTVTGGVNFVIPASLLQTKNKIVPTSEVLKTYLNYWTLNFQQGLSKKTPLYTALALSSPTNCGMGRGTTQDMANSAALGICLFNFPGNSVFLAYSGSEAK